LYLYLTMDLRLIFYDLRDKERKHSRLTVTQINNIVLQKVD